MDTTMLTMSYKFAHFDPGPVLEDFENDTPERMEIDEPPRILRIAVDFGTTFTSVAYAFTPERDYYMRLSDIACIARYPGDNPVPMITQQWEPRQDVPTELLYTATNNRSKSLRRRTKPLQKEAESDYESPNEADERGGTSSESVDGEEHSNEPAEATLWENQDQSDALSWGFQVQEQLTTGYDSQNEWRHVTNMKLVLDKPQHEEHNVNEITSTTRKRLQKLTRQKFIRSESDAITHYLEKLLVHVKNELDQSGRWNATTKIEYILCVPAVWPSKACRIMQKSMAKAVKRSGLSTIKNDELENLFIVSEPEAAATCIMAEQENSLVTGETIVIVDAGGGTVDAVTYQITNTDPLRVSAEIIPPKTISCGASYINKDYRKWLVKKLANKKYLEKNGKTIDSIIEREVLRFENTEKRIWNPNDPSRNIRPIYIDNLRASRTDKKICQNYLMVSERNARSIFQYSLDGTAKVLEDQLDMAKAKGYSVQTVLLTGGFGQSPFLQSHLQQFLDKQEYLNLDGQRIQLLVPRAASTAVARGAVLRASNKELGPPRISSCSYGFLRSEPWQPEVCAAHRGAKREIDRVDGEEYVLDTIHWLFPKGEELEAGKQRSITVKHTFPVSTGRLEGQEKLICKEFLYVADDFKESHYRNNHPMNKGAELAGEIAVDMTFLKNHGLKPEIVSEHSTFRNKNKRVWVVEFELVITVYGRNLIYSALWPIRKPGEDASMVQQQVVESSEVCIAASFKPGTA